MHISESHLDIMDKLKKKSTECGEISIFPVQSFTRTNSCSHMLLSFTKWM